MLPQIQAYIAETLGSEMFKGGIGVAAAGALLYQLRAVPKLVGDWTVRHGTTKLVIDNSDDLFERVAVYFSRNQSVNKARWLRMVELYDDEKQKWGWNVSFGPGWHFIKDHGDWFAMHRHIEEKSTGMTLRRRETLTIYTLGRSQQPLRDLMVRAEQVYEQGSTVRVYVWHEGGYVLADRKPKRPLDTLFLPPVQKDRIVDDLMTWSESRDQYRQRGTPWRRGYLLEGPPGTGKTSLAFAMAGLLDRPICMINLANIGGDTALQAAFNFAEPGAVIIMEDVDTVDLTHERKTKSKAEKREGLVPEVTLSGLLNAVDGMASRENRVVIMTSNRADILDEALLRPGRVDLREHVGLIEAPEAMRMCEAFGPGVGFFRVIAGELPMSPAKLQGMLIKELG